MTSVLYCLLLGLLLSISLVQSLHPIIKNNNKNNNNSISTDGGLAQSVLNETRYLFSHSRSSATVPIIYCPNVGTLDLPSGITTIRLAISSPKKLCTLTKSHRSKTNEVFPVGRSYDNNEWEAVAGPYDTLTYNCDSVSCEVNIVDINDKDSKFQLTSFEHSITERDETARFFEQATFGVTLGDLTEMEKQQVINPTSNLLPYFTQWTYDQMYNQSTTSHRETFRERALNPYNIGDKGREAKAKTQPCEEGSYWRGYTFTEMDRYKHVTVDHVNGTYVLSVDGKFRTITKTWKLKESTPDNSAFPISFRICKVQPETFGNVGLDFDGRCRRLLDGNPPIDIDGMNPPPPTINGISMLESVMVGDRIEKMSLEQFTTQSNTNSCTPPGNQHTFVKIFNQKFTQAMIFEPHLALRENRSRNPLADGGGEGG